MVWLRDSAKDTKMIGRIKDVMRSLEPGTASPGRHITLKVCVEYDVSVDAGQFSTAVGGGSSGCYFQWVHA